MANKQLVVDDALHKLIKMAAAECGMSIKDFVQIAVNELMKKYDQQENKREQ